MCGRSRGPFETRNVPHEVDCPRNPPPPPVRQCLTGAGTHGCHRGPKGLLQRTVPRKSRAFSETKPGGVGTWADGTGVPSQRPCARAPQAARRHGRRHVGCSGHRTGGYCQAQCGPAQQQTRCMIGSLDPQKAHIRGTSRCQPETVRAGKQRSAMFALSGPSGACARVSLASPPAGLDAGEAITSNAAAWVARLRATHGSAVMGRYLLPGPGTTDGRGQGSIERWGRGGGRGGGGVWDPTVGVRKWPDRMFPLVNFVFSHDGHFGLGGRGVGPGGGSPPLLLRCTAIRILPWQRGSRPAADAQAPPGNRRHRCQSTSVGRFFAVTPGT